MEKMKDSKPHVWVGHVFMRSRDLEASRAFLISIGMREIFANETIGVLELRAGTHLVLQQGEPEFKDGELYFDLMVEDLHATRADFVTRGFNPSEVVEGRVHKAFMVDEPGGNRIRFNDSHASDYPL